ncbi:MAG: response regulator [Anaerolineales bacterium]|nr:response regulator [Anaerolineales bacterium]
MQKRILLVDDDPRNLRLLEGMLYTEPYDLLRATSGQEALALIEAESPDLVLLDIMMPGMSGYEVCQTIKSQPSTRMIPVVMVTALHEVNDRIQAMEAGADDFLSKPIDAAELIVRVRSLLKLRSLYLDLERVTAERLQFMAGVAHDIRSPLNALILNMDILGKHLDHSDPKIQRIWSRINTCSVRIDLLAHDVMNYYRTEAGQFVLDIQDSDLQSVVQTAHDVVAAMAEEKQIQLQIEHTLSKTVPMDEQAIVQVLVNLLTNAIEYTETSGCVMLRCYNLADGHYLLPENHYPPIMLLPPRGVVVEVQDTGSGIESTDYIKVFQEFVRLSTQQQGVGLGLSVSQRLVRLHGGEIWVSSLAGEGTTFAFFLPDRRPI